MQPSSTDETYMDDDTDDDIDDDIDDRETYDDNEDEAIWRWWRDSWW